MSVLECLTLVRENTKWSDLKMVKPKKYLDSIEIILVVATPTAIGPVKHKSNSTIIRKIKFWKKI